MTDHMTPFAAVQAALLADPRTWAKAAREIDARLRAKTGPSDPPGRVALRLLTALGAAGSAEAAAPDLAALVRHAIRVHRQSLTFPASVLARFAEQIDGAGLTVRSVGADAVEVRAQSWSPRWLWDGDRIDELARRRVDPPAVGDGMVQRVLGRPTYQSDAQKAAVLACVHAPPGSVTLVTLPTGAGKSLCAQLPAWVETSGGRINGGTTILIVPTIALAQDQLRQARELFRDAAVGASRPMTWLGETPLDERAAIRAGLLAGTLPLLITSPEALMLSESLRAACERAAATGRLTRIVVDEIHLVERWGAGFRTAFQFLGGLHRRLLEASGGRLRLLLLSATVSGSCEALLRRLYGGGSSFQMVRANRLRPEPAYWFSVSDDFAERQARVLETLRHAPRPAILYVTQPKVAYAWVRTLREEGYRRVAAFTGETPDEERHRLNRAWQADEIDVMVATSAFGLGIDKADVRTILHAALPETTDRFYQEVGRAGRDGWSAASLMLLERGDARVPEAMLGSSTISTEKGVSRIKGMMQSWEARKDSGDVYLIDMDATPHGQPDLRQGERNREWNEHTLLLAQRAGILEVLDSHPPERRGAEGRVRSLVEVRIVNDAALRFPDSALMTLFQAARSREKTEIMGTIAELDAMAGRYADGSADRCLATQFAALYPDCAEACGGCPVCRARQTAPYASRSEVALDMPDEGPPSGRASIHDDVSRRMGFDARMTVDWDGQRDAADMRRLRPLLVALVRSGIRQVILPDELAADEAWVAELVGEDGLGDPTVGSHAILTAAWVADHWQRPVFPMPTVVVYPPDNAAADALHRAIGRREELRGVPTVSVVHQALELPSLGGRFRDKVDGITLPIATLEHELRALRIPVNA